MKFYITPIKNMNEVCVTLVDECGTSDLGVTLPYEDVMFSMIQIYNTAIDNNDTVEYIITPSIPKENSSWS